MHRRARNVLGVGTSEERDEVGDVLGLGVTSEGVGLRLLTVNLGPATPLTWARGWPAATPSFSAKNLSRLSHMGVVTMAGQ